MNYLEWLWGKGARRDSGGKFFLEYDSPFRTNDIQFYNGQPIEWDARSGTFLNNNVYDSPNTLNWSSDFNPDIIDFGDFSVDINNLLDPNNFAGSDLALEQRGIVFQSGGGNLEVTPDSKNRVREFFSGVGSGLLNDIKEFAKNAGPDLAKYLLAKAITGYLTKDDNDAINEFRDILKKDNEEVREANRVARERREALTSRLQDRILNRLDSESTPYDNIPVPQRLPSFNPNIQRFNTRDGQGGHVGSLADATMYRYAPSFLAPQDPNVDPFSTESIRDFSDRATSPWASGQPWRSAKPWENDPNFDPDAGNGSDTVGSSANQRDSYNQGREFQRDEWTDRGLDIMRGQRKQPSFGWRDKEGNITEYTGDGVIGDEYMKYLRQVQERNANLPPDKRISALSPQELEAQQKAMTTGASFGTAFNEPPLERRSGEELIASYGSDGFPNSGSISQQMTESGASAEKTIRDDGSGKSTRRPTIRRR